MSLENRTISSSLLALLSGVPVALFLLPSTLKNLKRTIIHKRKRGSRKKKRTRKKRKDKTRPKRGNSHALKCHKHAHLYPPATGEKLEQPALGERNSRQARTVSQRACGARHQACPTHGIPNPAQARKSAKVRVLVFLAQVHHAES